MDKKKFLFEVIIPIFIGLILAFVVSFLIGNTYINNSLFNNTNLESVLLNKQDIQSNVILLNCPEFEYNTNILYKAGIVFEYNGKQLIPCLKNDTYYLNIDSFDKKTDHIDIMFENKTYDNYFGQTCHSDDVINLFKLMKTSILNLTEYDMKHLRINDQYNNDIWYCFAYDTIFIDNYTEEKIYEIVLYNGS